MNSMTEDQARERWCPFARVADSIETSAPAANRLSRFRGVTNDPLVPDAFCIASDCMAWRVSGVVRDEDGEGPWLGYCGLAGKP